MGFAIMEGLNGTLCRTRRIAEADSDLHCDRTEKIAREGVITSGPETIAAFISHMSRGSGLRREQRQRGYGPS